MRKARDLCNRGWAKCVSAEPFTIRNVTPEPRHSNVITVSMGPMRALNTATYLGTAYSFEECLESGGLVWTLRKLKHDDQALLLASLADCIRA